MQFFKRFTFITLLSLIGGLTSCSLNEDPGPIQYNEQLYTISDFNRLDIGDAMVVTVTVGNIYSITAKGDRRNLDDLELVKAGNTLITKFSKNRDRKHTTYIVITMPSLLSANFYGATTASISGFEEESFALNLSGASVAQIDMVSELSKVNLSGSSNLTISGYSKGVVADLSGASLLKAYNTDVEDVNVVVSGASHAYVRASKTLVAEASGASSILYRGDAVVTLKSTGASSIIKD